MGHSSRVVRATYYYVI